MPESELLDEGPVRLEIGVPEVGQQALPGPDHLKQPATPVVILGVGAEVIGEGVDSLGEKRHLNPGGVGLFNMIGSVAGQDSKLVRSEYKTIRQVFRSCAYFPILEDREQPDDYSPTNVRNVILVAGEQLLAPAEVRRRAAALKNPRLPHLLPAAEAFTGRPLPTGDVPLLSDDFAPVDRLIPVP